MEAEASRSVATVAQVSVHLVLSSAGFGRTFFFVPIVSPVWSLWALESSASDWRRGGLDPSADLNSPCLSD